MLPDVKYHAFISYSHRDRIWGDWLHKALETYKVPPHLIGKDTGRGYKVPERVYPVFRDREELPTATDLGAVIGAALQDAAKQLDERMRDIRSSGHVIGLERIAVMAAPNLSHELIQSSKSGAANAAPDLTPLLSRLDKTLAQFE